MADIVGSAYVRIRGITTQLGSDIQDGVDDGVDGLDTSKLEKKMSDGMKRGMEDGVKKTDLSPNTEKMRKKLASEVKDAVTEARPDDIPGVENAVKKSAASGMRKAFKDSSIGKSLANFSKRFKAAVSKAFGSGMSDYDKDKSFFSRFSWWFRRGLGNLFKGAWLKKLASTVGSIFGGRFTGSVNKKTTKGITDNLNKLFKAIPMPPTIALLVAMALPAIGGLVKAAVAYVGALVGQVGYLLTAIAGVGTAALGMGAAIGFGLLPIMLAFKAETPAMDKFKESISQQADAWLEVGVATQVHLLPALDRAFAKLSRMTPLFTDLGTEMGKIIGGMAEMSAEALTSSKNMDAWKTVFAGSEVIMSNISEIVVGLMDILPRFLGAVMPLSIRLSESLTTGFGNFFDYLDRTIATGEFEAKLTLWYDRAELVGRALWNLVKALWNVFQVGADKVTPMFENLDEWAIGFLEWTESIEGNTALEDFFGNAVEVAQEFNALVAELLRWMAEPITAGDTEGIIGFMESLREDWLPLLKDLFAALGEGLGPRMLDLAEAFVVFIAALEEAELLGQTLTLLADILDLFTDLLALPVFGPLIGDIIGLAYALKLLNMISFGRLAWGLGALGTTLGQLMGGTYKPGPFMQFLFKLGRGLKWLGLLLLPVIKAIGSFIAGLVVVGGSPAWGSIAIIIGVVIAVVGALWFAFKYWDQIPGWIATAWQAIKDFGKNVWDWVKGIPEAIGGMVSDVGDKLSEFGGMFTDALGEIWDSITGIPEAIGEMASDFGTAVADFVTGIPAMFDEGAASLASWISEAVPIMLEKVGYFIGRLLGELIFLPFKIIGALAEAAVALWNWISEAVPAALTAFGEWRDSLFDTLNTFAGELADKMADSIESLWGWITEAIPDALAALGDFSVKVWNWTGKFSSELPGKMRDAASAIWDWVSEAAGKATTNLSEFARSVWSWGRTFMRELPGKFIGYITSWWSFGSALGSAILSGLQGAVGTVMSWGGTLISAISQGIYDAAPTWMQPALRWMVGSGQKFATESAAGFMKMADHVKAMAGAAGNAVVGAWNWITGQPSTNRATVSGPESAFGATRFGLGGANPFGAAALAAGGGVGGISSPYMNLVVQIGDRDITDIVDTRFSEDMGEMAHGLFVRRP